VVTLLHKVTLVKSVSPH